jgi:hypothetical protein
MRLLRLIATAAFAVLLSACVGREFQSKPTPLPTVNPTETRQAEIGGRDYEGYFVSIDCLDSDADGSATAADLEHMGAPDLTLDGVTDAVDIRSVGDLGLDIGLSGRCQNISQYFLSKPSAVDSSCDGSFAIIAGITGQTDESVLGLKSGAGVRGLLAAMTDRADQMRVPWAVVLSTPQIDGASAPNPAMEQWLDVTLSGMLTAKPCAKLVLVGHSHGGVTASAVAYRLEQRGLGSQIAYVALIDRIPERYQGDKMSLPSQAYVLNVYQTNSTPEARNGVPLADETHRFDDVDYSDKVPNVDAAAGTATPALIDHESIDDDLDIRNRIVTEALIRVTAADSP